MKFLQFLFSPIILVLMLTLAACGDSTSNANNTANTGSSATTPTAASTMDITLHTASARLNGKTVMLLTNAQSMTLYYFQPDTSTTAACTGGCASTWPPFLSNDSSMLTSATSLSGKLTIQANANGQQIEYNGHPLYTYSGDTSPGQTNGEGISNQWFVATTDLAVNNGDQKAPSNGGKYGDGY
jgi:predicted lipoprotein with Yx(FWY)xxD motif